MSKIQFTRNRLIWNKEQQLKRYPAWLDSLRTSHSLWISSRDLTNFNDVATIIAKQLRFMNVMINFTPVFSSRAWNFNSRKPQNDIVEKWKRLRWIRDTLALFYFSVFASRLARQSHAWIKLELLFWKGFRRKINFSMNWSVTKFYTWKNENLERKEKTRN